MRDTSTACAHSVEHSESGVSHRSTLSLTIVAFTTVPEPPYLHRYSCSSSPCEKPVPTTVSFVPPLSGPVIGTMCDTRIGS